jgi:polar amino acid transport system substrate-binding protein
VAAAAVNWRQRTILAYLDEPPFCAPPQDELLAAGPTGCDVEVAFAILSAVGVARIETRLVTFAELLPGVAAGAWQINTPLFITEERGALVDFSRPVWSLADGLMVRAQERRTLDSYDALAAAKDARLVVVADQVQEQRALSAGVTPDRVLRVATQADSVKAVLENRADAYASVVMAHRGYLHANPDDRLRIMDFAATGGVAALGAYSFSKRDSDLRRAFDEELGRFLGTPAHREIMWRHGFTDADVDSVV